MKGESCEFNREFKGVKGEWHVSMAVHQHLLRIQTISDLSMEHFEAEMTEEKISNDKNFAFLFENVQNLFLFLESAFSQLVIKRGQIVILVDMPLGKLTRKMELKIETHRKEVDQSMLRELKFKKLQTQLEALSAENNEMKARMKENQEEMNKLRQIFKRFQQTLEQKDEVINSIFAELKEIRQWKEERESEELVRQKRKFIADPVNPHNLKFLQIGNRFKKSGGGSWDLLMCRNEIEKNDIFRYTIRQIKAGSGGSFMYGIATASVRGINRAQDHKEFIGYYQNTGNIYDRGQSRKGGPRIKDGDYIAIEVDTRNWMISWWIEGTKQAQIAIGGDLRVKPIFLALVIYNDQAEVQFV